MNTIVASIVMFPCVVSVGQSWRTAQAGTEERRPIRALGTNRHRRERLQYIAKIYLKYLLAEANNNIVLLENDITQCVNTFGKLP